MHIDKRLNLVIPLEQPGKGRLYIHSTPLSPEAFRQHFEIIAQTFSAIHGRGYGALAGPRIAGLLMRKISETAGVWDGPDGVEAGVMNEIRRLTMVIMPGQSPPTILLGDAVQRGILDPTEQDILENALTFFTVISAMHRPGVLRALLVAMCGMWDAQISSLNSTAFAASLPISSGDENTGGKKPA